MAVALRRSRSFDATSPVARYWLANCLGFAVTGGVHGVVEAVQSEADPHDPETIVVRCSKHRVRTLPASALLSVVPSDRVLVVDHVPGAVESAGGEAARLTGRGARVGGRLLARLCALGWRWACRGWAAGSPVAAAGFRRGGKELVRLIASVPWQRFGRSARSATTNLWQGTSRGWSRLRTTSSGPSSGKSSGDDRSSTSST